MIDCIEEIRSLSENKKIVFVSGNFNIVHPGHLRLFKFAKENGDFLVVGINRNTPRGNFLSAEIRLEGVQHSSYVDFACILEILPEAFIEHLRPDLVLKGSEYSNKLNQEENVVKKYGGKLIFSSGDSVFSSLDLLKSELTNIDLSSIGKPLDFCKRHSFSFSRLKEILQKFSQLNVMVIGDTIVDEYIMCEALGMSQEDPTIVVSPILSNTFLGGAGIVSAHARGMGANVKFFSVSGNDKAGEFAKQKLLDSGVESYFAMDDSRPTTLKQRYRAGNKTLLRVNHLRQHYISKEIQEELFDEIEKTTNIIDLIIFSDFSYGCLPEGLIQKVVSLAKTHNITMTADSQSSSQTGDISKFGSMDLVTPTEREIRLSVDDFESGLMVISEKLQKLSNAKNIFITMASEGVIINQYKENDFFTDRLPAMNSNPKDVAGAGDSMLAISSMALAVGANIWEAAYLGSIAAACQISRTGNVPLKIKEILREINA